MDLDHEPSRELPFGERVDERPVRLHREVEAPWDRLSERERRVLFLRFGLEDGRSHTLEEVGRELGVTAKSVRRIEARALRQFRPLGWH